MTTTSETTRAEQEIIARVERGDLENAAKVADAFVQRYPTRAELWRLKAICHLQLGQNASGREALAHALRLEPRSTDALCNLASLESTEGNREGAKRVLRHVLVIAPNHAGALNNLGLLVQAEGDATQAAQYFERAATAQPEYVQAWLNLSNARLAELRLDEAEKAGRRALNLEIKSADGWYLLGLIFDRQQRLSDSISAYRASLDLAPRARTAHNLALVLDRSGAWPAAARMYERALELDPQLHAALSQLVLTKRRIGEWDGLASLSARLRNAVIDGADGVTPFSFLCEEPASPELQLACARLFADGIKRSAAGRTAQPSAPRRIDASKPLRVGFFAAGFNQHATALLMVEMIEQLRGSRITTLGFASTPDDGSPRRKRITAAFHEFHDVSARPVASVTRALAEKKLDILIDVDGYCEGALPSLFASRPAPLIVNWLAYPGSLGAPWYDYLIADTFVVPVQQQHYYDEKLAYLPRCYQPNDTTRTVDDPPPREACGLPSNGVVYCCFNNSYKLSPHSFGLWMNVLREVPDSCLWLLDGSPGCGLAERLRASAQAQGVAPARLVINPKLPHADYLARFRHADLFLDTTPYNAHTTASDALWAGCPVLTAPGVTFAARVAGSLNHHLGMSSMNASSDAEFVETAIRAGRDPDFRKHLRSALFELRESSDLFDMRGFATDFANLLHEMAQRQQAGLAPGQLG